MMMKSSKRKSFVLSAVLASGFLLGATGQAQASVILTSESQLSAGNQILSAPGNDYDNFSNPLDIGYTGGTASFNGPGGSVQRYEQGGSWNGNFAPGDPLFYTGTSGSLELFFSSDVTEVGTQFQPNFNRAFTAYISAFDASNNLIGTFSRADGNSNGNADNSAVFLGFRNTAGDAAIRRVLFSTTNDEAGFAINQVSFGNNAAAVPEPSTYAMFGLGVLALVALSRRKRQDNANETLAFNGAAC